MLDLFIGAHDGGARLRGGKHRDEVQEGCIRIHELQHLSQQWMRISTH